MKRVALLVLLVPALAGAEKKGAASPSPSGDFSWDQVVGEEGDAYQTLMAEGDREVLAAARGYARHDLRMRVQRALRAYQGAVSLRPDSPEAHYRLGHTLYTFFIADREDRPPAAEHVAATLRHYDRFLELSPLDPRYSDVLFHQSLALTKQADDDGFRRAVAIYDRLLAMSSEDSVDPSTISIYLGNKAELHMMLGDLDDAIENYQQAMAFGTRAWLGYGLAVALDRDGQATKAREVMQANLSSDRSMRRLGQDGTFFVPAGEKHYYLALGYEALGEAAEAVRHYRAFIDSGAHPRFHARARHNIQKLEPRARRMPIPPRGRESVDLD